MIAWPSYVATIAWFAACWKFSLGELGAVWGTMMLLLPMRFLLQRGTSVKLGDFSEEWLEFRFKLQEYAEFFASANHVVAQNSETIQDELRAAIRAVRGVDASESMAPEPVPDYFYGVRPKKD